jgi:hypothetical protein
MQSGNWCAWAAQLGCQRHRTPLIKWEEARGQAGELSGHVYQVRIHCEMREAAAVGQKWLTWIAVSLVLPNSVFHVLPVEWILQLRGENRDSVQE